ncbi:MAG: glycosyltransferase family 39 protein [Elusimicrobia bacterium]|nr:glycosyltransferase family 39 protein [Elusimicrobiota bacterium]
MESRLPFLTRWSVRRFELGVFALALAVRVAALVVFQVKGLGEAYGRDLYFNLALSWLGHLPMPDFDATHPPLFTLVIAAVLGALRTSSQLPILIFNVLVGSASVVLARRAGVRLLDEKTARLAALWIALDPALIFFTPQLQTETLFIGMILAFFWGLFALWDEPLSWRHAALGLWGGLAVTCRSVFGAFPGFLFFALWRAKGFARALLFCVLLAPGWFLPSGLWTARNYLRYGELIPLSGQMGSTLWEGFTLDREVVRTRPPEMRAETTRLGYGDRAVGPFFFERWKAFVRENPLQSAVIVAGKAVLYWRPWLYDPYPVWQRAVMGAYFTVLFAFALLGVRAVRRSRAPWGAVWAVLAYHTAVHAVFLTTLRYRVPLEPFLVFLAAAGAAPYLERPAGKRG